MIKVKLQNTAQIATASELGSKVHWLNDGYDVISDESTFLGYGVLCVANGYYTPLTYSDLDDVYTYELSV